MAPQIHLHQPKTEKVIRYALNNALPAIEKLSRELKQRRLHFVQNYRVGNYSFDFYCSKLKIAIEIDGYAHEFTEIYSNDTLKKLHIQSLGITVFRFTDYQILTDIEEILRALKYHQRFSKHNTNVV